MTEIKVLKSKEKIVRSKYSHCNTNEDVLQWDRRPLCVATRWDKSGRIHSLFSTDNFVFSQERFDNICLPAFLKGSQEGSAIFNNFRHSSVSQ